MPFQLPTECKFAEEMIATCKKIGTRGKGILAADESTGTIGKRLASINVENTPENRQKYRELLFTSKDIGKYISGVIMYEETLFDKCADGTPFVKVLQNAGVVPGIKVDMGTRSQPFTNGEVYTQGLTDLDKRAKKYYEQGARFAKWRAVLKIQDGYITDANIRENAWTLARYGAICQANGLAPIIEPEILMDGDHSLAVNAYWTQKVLGAVYKAMNDQNLITEGTMLKPNMCLPGKQNGGERSFEANAKATFTALSRTVPPAMPAVVFLSGGMSEEEATNNLNTLNKLYGDKAPWSLTFSFGRALQQSCLQAWKGDDKNKEAGQKQFMIRAKANGEAQLGKYTGDAASEASKKSLYEKGYKY